jgi:hypothetical protein
VARTQSLRSPRHWAHSSPEYMSARSTST